jgi:hypothetical protein
MPPSPAPPEHRSRTLLFDVLSRRWLAPTPFTATDRDDTLTKWSPQMSAATCYPTATFDLKHRLL